jgi:hypothetical protein
LFNQGNDVYLVSCGEDSGRDVWLTTHVIGAMNVPVPPKIWQNPVILEQSETSILTPKIIADDKFVHSFWREADSSAQADQAGLRIRYSRWNGNSWSRGVAVSPPARGDVAYFAGISSQNNLFLVWSGGINGQLFFSRVSTEQAVLASEWIEPRSLPLPSRQIVGEVTLQADNDGNLYLIYVIPLNEDRGAYLLTSSDRGDSWSEPTKVFDGSLAEWHMVDQPRFALAQDGQMHLLLLHRPSPFGNKDAALYYLTSTDMGDTWSAIAPVETENRQSNSVIWSDIVSPRAGVAHRVWQEWNGNQLISWHQISENGGVDWIPAIQISNIDKGDAPTNLLVDKSGQVHLLQLINGQTLRHKTWMVLSWKDELDFQVTVDPDTEINNLTSVAAANDQLLSMFTANMANDEFPVKLIFSQRQIDNVDSLPTPEPVATPVVVAEVTVSPTPKNASPEPTATIPFPREADNSEITPLAGLTSGGTIQTGIVLALIPAALLIMLGVFIQLRLRRR